MSKRLCVWLGMLALPLTAMSCTSLFQGEPVDPEAVWQAIDQAGAQFALAFNKGDGATVGAFYVENARVLPPNSPPVSGKSNIQDFWQGFIDSTVWREFQLHVLHVESQDGLAYEVGSYALEFQPQGDNAPIADTGKYVVVWKRQGDGLWKIAADIWNSDLPVEP